MFRYTKISLFAIAAFSTAAIAAKGMDNDAQSISKANIPLTQAISIAEKHANGKATRAEFENTRQGGIYEVEVVCEAKVFDVRIDADKGIVLSSAEDSADNDHDEDD